MIKFLKKGIRANNEYYPVSYSLGTLIDGVEYITIYAKSIIKGLPKELNPINNSETMTDYFEVDRIKFAKGTDMYNKLLKLC